MTTLDRRALAEVGTGCTCFSLRKAARAATQLYDDALRPSGLRATQFTLLALLAGHGAMPIGELAEASVTDRTTLTRNLALLERRGLVRMEPGDDARVRLAAITARGEKALAEALPLWRRAQAAVEEQLGTARITRLVADLGHTAQRLPKRLRAGRRAG